MIKVYCNGTRIQCLRQGELTVGMAGAPIEFDFSEEWNGLSKTAVFRCDGARDVIVGTDGVAVVPHEILTTPGMDVEVGVYAEKEDGTTWPAPTPFCRIGRVKEGADPSGDESYPPTPDVGAQAVAAASSAMQAAAAAQEVAAEIQRRADSGEFDGAPGYTPVKGKDYFDGAPGKDGNDYVLTEADKVEIAEIAADLVDVPEGGGSADLTGYATEEWVKAGYQPKGNYLTEVPAGYAKTEDIPTKPSDIGAQPAGNYATKSEIPTVPTKLSAFTNDAGFVTEDALENLGGKAYVQNTQPVNMEEGEFWYNPDEEPEGGEISGGGGGEEWRIIKTIKLTENVQNIIIDTDNDGKPFSLKKFIIWGWTQGTASGGQLRINAAVRTDSANSYFGSWIANFRGLDTTKRYWRFECSRGPVVGDRAKWYSEVSAADSGVTLQASSVNSYYVTPEDDNGNDILTATFINILSNTSTVQFAAGSEIELWGVDA